MEDRAAQVPGAGMERKEADSGAAQPAQPAGPIRQPQRLRMSLATTDGLTLSSPAAERGPAGGTMHSGHRGTGTSPQRGSSSSSRPTEGRTSKATPLGHSSGRGSGAGADQRRAEAGTAFPGGVRALTSAYPKPLDAGPAGRGRRQDEDADASGSEMSGDSDASDVSSAYTGSADGHGRDREDRKLRRKWRRILGLKCYVRRLSPPAPAPCLDTACLTPLPQVPDLVWRRALQDAALPSPPPLLPYCARERCAVMLADISGFTPLTVRARAQPLGTCPPCLTLCPPQERLSKLGARGTELLSETLNRYFSRMISLVRLPPLHAPSASTGHAPRSHPLSTTGCTDLRVRRRRGQVCR